MGFFLFSFFQIIMKSFNPYFLGNSAWAKDRQNVIKAKFCFNPYFLGNSAWAIDIDKIYELFLRCFNPYFLGNSAWACFTPIQKSTTYTVSILIFLEIARGRKTVKM